MLSLLFDYRVGQNLRTLISVGDMRSLPFALNGVMNKSIEYNWAGFHSDKLITKVEMKAKKEVRSTWSSTSNLARFCRVIMDSFKAAKCQSQRKSKSTKERQKNLKPQTRLQHKRGKAKNIDPSHTSSANKNRKEYLLSQREKRKKQKSKDNPHSQEKQSK